MKYRFYIDRSGRMRIVEVPKEKRIASMKFDAFVVIVSVACFISFCVAAGLI